MFDYEAVCAVRERADTHLDAAREFSAGETALVLVSSGACTCACRGGLYPLSAGTLLAAQPPFTLSAERPCHLLACAMSGLAARLCAETLSQPLVQDIGYYPAMPALLARVQTAEEPRLLSGAGYEMLCLLQPELPRQPAYPPLAADAVALIRENFAGLYGVDELSEKLGVSKSHLVRSFREAVGVTPGQYLTRTRVEAAQQLLSQREYPLEIVAHLCGFDNANYLCKVFRKVTGQTPTQYRTRNAPAAKRGERLKYEEEPFL